METEKWIKVTKPSELKVGDRVRYCRNNKDWWGNSDKDLRYVSYVKGDLVKTVFRHPNGLEEMGANNLFVMSGNKYFWDTIEVLKTINTHDNKKSVTLTFRIIQKGYGTYNSYYSIIILDSHIHGNFFVHNDQPYTRKSDAKRAIKSLCKAFNFNYTIKE